MSRGIPACVLFFSFSLLLSCSFNYTEGDGAGKVLPEMVIEAARATRYEDARIKVVFNADVLEIYDSDRVWAGEKVSFVEYAADASGAVEMEGAASLLVIDDKEGVYSLGNGAFFHLVDDDIKLTAEDLKWTKKTHQLSGSAEGLVKMEESDGSIIQGTGFFADSLRRYYLFDSTVSGFLMRDGSSE
jgi:hypothetical protein